METVRLISPYVIEQLPQLPPFYKYSVKRNVGNNQNSNILNQNDPSKAVFHT